MTTLANLGVEAQRAFITNQSSVSVGGMNVSQTSQELTKLTMMLPRPTSVHASFRKESWGDALVKVFKKELQTGDPAFDKLVYITTDTPDATSAFLRSPDTRNAIALAIETGGPIEIAGNQVVAHSIGHDRNDDPTIVRIIAALLGPF